MQSRVVLGRVVGAHGLQGEVRVQYFGDSPDNLLQQPVVWLADGTPDEHSVRHEVLRTGQGRSGEVRLALKGVNDRDAAAGLRGRLVLGDSSKLAPLEDGEFYWHELVGCLVERTDGTPIGTVQEIWETGAHDVLVVADDSGARHLFSTARELMPEVDVAGQRIVVEVLPGMLDDPDSRETE